MALYAAHPGARLAIELTSTMTLSESFSVSIVLVNKDHFVRSFAHDDNFLNTSTSDSSSNTSSLKSLTSGAMKYLRLAVCNDVNAIRFLKAIEWWCLRPIFFEEVCEVLPLAITLRSVSANAGDGKSSNRSHMWIETPPLSMLKLEHSAVRWIYLTRLDMLQHLTLDNCELVSNDLRELAPLCNLVTISLNRLDQLRSLDGLTSCTELKSIHVYSCPHLHTVSAIRCFHKLKELDINGLTITSLVPSEDTASVDLAGPREEANGQLEVVRLVDCPSLTDVGFLRYHPYISHIFLSRLPIDKIEWLSCYRELKQIVFQYLPELRLGSLEPEKTPKLNFLKRLIIDQPHSDSSLEILLHCDNLEDLQLRGWNHRVDWSLVGSLQLLRTLRLSHNASLNTLSWIRQCTFLRVLNISLNVSIDDFSPIAALHCLEKLNLSATRVTNDHIASIAAGCTNLVRVNLDNCLLLRDLSPLGQLQMLSTFSASNTRITSIEWIVQCRHLVKVSLRQCTELDDMSPLDRLPALKVRDI